jgi:hypothetical protein
LLGFAVSCSEGEADLHVASDSGSIIYQPNDQEQGLVPTSIIAPHLAHKATKAIGQNSQHQQQKYQSSSLCNPAAPTTQSLIIIPTYVLVMHLNRTTIALLPTKTSRHTRSQLAYPWWVLALAQIDMCLMVICEIISVIECC